MTTAPTTRRFELLCISMLSIGQLCIMTGYDTESFISESVIHSIHQRDPGRIDKYAGYYGQAVIYLTFVTACLFSPSFLYATSAKVTLVMSAICFTSFPLGFLFTNSYYYYFSSALTGVGFALYYTGNGGYITSHSTRKTIESNVSLSWSFGCCCMIVGSVIMSIIITITQKNGESVVTADKPFVERQFSEMEIFLIFTVFTIISSIAIITFLLIPSKDVTNCIEPSERKVSFKESMKLMFDTLKSPKMFSLAPSYLLCGIFTSLWMCVLPTTLLFNIHNSKLIYLPAVYGFGFGLGETMMGLTISTMSRRIKDFGLKPTMLIGCLLSVIYCVLTVMTTPFNATYKPTRAEPLGFQPSYLSTVIIAMIGGMADCCHCSIRAVTAALAMPTRRAQAFSVSKIYQSIGTCFIFFFSPLLNIYYYVIGIPILCIFAGTLFFQEAGRIRRMEEGNKVIDSQVTIIENDELKL